jgi:3',5'-cyclic-AMP phosphodiesterase
VRVFRKYPFKDRELIVDFDAATHQYLHFEEGQGDGRPEDLRKRRTLS